MECRPRIAPLALLLLTLTALVPFVISAQVTTDRLLNAAKEPHNWLMYSGTYSSHRHTTLDQITPANVRNLEVKWVSQARVLQSVSATPLVVDGIMYMTHPPNDVVATSGLAKLENGMAVRVRAAAPAPGA